MTVVQKGSTVLVREPLLVLICPVCQTKNPDDSQVCLKCGTDLKKHSTRREHSEGQLEPSEDSVVLERDSKGFNWLAPAEDDGSVGEIGFLDSAPPSFATTDLSPSSSPSPDDLALTSELLADAMAGRSHSIAAIKATEPSPMPDLPEVVMGISTPSSGIFSKMAYAMRTRRLVRQQRENVKQLTTALSKLKRNEIESIEALGRAARQHNLTPSSMLDRAAAADLEDQAAQERREIAGAKKEEGHQAEQLFKATHRAGQARLEKLRDISAPLLARHQQLEQRRIAARNVLEELAAKEVELGALAERRPTEEELGGEIHMENEKIVVSRRSVDEEISARMMAHHDCLAQVAEAKEALNRIEGHINATVTPLERIKAEAATIKSRVSAAQDKVKATKKQAKAAAMSGQRRTDFAHRSAAELDAQIGQAILDGGDAHPALDLLVKAIHSSTRRVQSVEAMLDHQNDQLAVYDGEAAKLGASVLIGAALFSIILAIVTLSVLGNVLSR